MRTFARALRGLTRRIKHTAPEPAAHVSEGRALATAAEQSASLAGLNEGPRKEVANVLSALHRAQGSCRFLWLVLISGRDVQVCHTCLRHSCSCNSPFTASEASSWPSSPLFWGIPQMCTTSGIYVPELPEPQSPTSTETGMTGTVFILVWVRHWTMHEEFSHAEFAATSSEWSWITMLHAFHSLLILHSPLYQISMASTICVDLGLAVVRACWYLSQLAIPSSFICARYI